MNIEDNKTLISYCFLAALTENNYNLIDDVYVPLCKRSLSYYSTNVNSFGHDSDLKETIEKIYGIRIPIAVLRQLLKKLEKSLSKKEKEKYSVNIFENGKSFEFNCYDFDKLEEEYEKSKRNVNKIEEAFLKYLKENEIEYKETYLLSEFINTNKNRLSTFFNSDHNIDLDEVNKSFIHHVNFLKYIETNNHELFKIAELLYLGSIVTCYLEGGIEIEANFDKIVEYYLDTQIILKALDLQEDFETLPAIELIELIKNSNGKIKILDITLNEINNIFNFAINNYNNKNSISTINDACIRKKKDKVWLINFHAKFESIIKSKYNIEVVSISQIQCEKFSKSNDIKTLKEIRKNQLTAQHDVLAYLYIRDKRNGFCSLPQKCKYWFISANKNLFQFNISSIPKGNISEIILPDILTSVLWLKNPSKFSISVKKVGLNTIMAQTLREEIPSKELLNHFNNNLKKYSEISEEDYNILASSLAHSSAKSIQKLNELAEDNNKDIFNLQIHQLIDQERKRINSINIEKRLNKETENMLYDKKIDLELKIDSLQSELVEKDKIIDIKEQTIDKNEKEIYQIQQEKINIYKKIKKYLIILIIIVFVFLLSIFIDFPTIVIKYILPLGGLWTFVNLIINIYSNFKKYNK